MQNKANLREISKKSRIFAEKLKIMGKVMLTVLASLGMKRYVFIALLFCLPMAATAQTVDTSARDYCVRYEKEHLFLQKDSGFNVVDYDVEWPEIVSYNEVVPLKRYLSGQIFDFATASLDSALMSINEVYGQPVAGMLKEIPADDRFCYVTASAKILSYMPGRWITYNLSMSVEPQRRSVYKEKRGSRVVVYDLTRNRVMLADDMLREGVKDMLAADDFYNRLFAPLSDDMYNNLVSSQIDGVWVDNGQIHFIVDAISTVEGQTYTVAMPYKDFRYVLTKNARNMVEKELKPQQPQFLSSITTWRGDTIYKEVERMPEFKGGTEGLRTYLSHVGNPNVRLDKAVRVYLSFVVDKAGDVRDVCVVSPVSPQLDEYAVGVIKGMPRFAAGSQGGKPVCVRLYIPVNFKP